MLLLAKIKKITSSGYRPRRTLELFFARQDTRAALGWEYRASGSLTIGAAATVL